jgi:hypothetical protein
MFFCAMGALGALVFFFALIAFVADSPASLKRQHRKADRDREAAEQYQGQAKENSVNQAIVETDKPPPDDNEAYTYRQERDRLDYVAFALSVLTFGIVAIYAALTYGLWQAANRQVIAAQETLRPWISTDSGEGMDDTLTLDLSRPNQTSIDYSLDIPLKNFGHSPATQVTPFAQLIWGPYKDIQSSLVAFGKYQCGPIEPLDMFLQFGTFIPPEARIFYPAPSAQTLIGKRTIKLGDKIQFWLIVCIAYINPSDDPPSLHHTCTRHMFRDQNGQGDIPVVQGAIKGKFMPQNGGCAK